MVYIDGASEMLTVIQRKTKKPKQHYFDSSRIYKALKSVWSPTWFHCKAKSTFFKSKLARLKSAIYASSTSIFEVDTFFRNN
jgi:hypothetical protein